MAIRKVAVFEKVNKDMFHLGGSMPWVELSKHDRTQERDSLNTDASQRSVFKEMFKFMFLMQAKAKSGKVPLQFQYYGG